MFKEQSTKKEELSTDLTRIMSGFQGYIIQLLCDTVVTYTRHGKITVI